ncbi:MAG: MFS transporter [Treponema sp.]|nr:MFS transporter [Candidatus Treponema equi]
MENKKKLGFAEKVSYGLGAVGKDMVYMFSASYVLYYFQDILGVSAIAMGVILLVARVFDAFNDPIMGVIVAKTKSRWGKFRPWLLVGTITNAVVLYLMFAAPPSLNGSGLVAYAAVTYILWGITYTMMDIPYWSMVPAFTEAGKEREGLSALARSCAGVGSAIVSIITVMAVSALGKAFGPENVERTGFKMFALIIAVVFIVFTLVMCICIKEKSTVDMKSSTVKEMFTALLKNDQAMVMVFAIVLINTALYITANLVIYFFKYDFSGPELWESHYTLFQTCSGGFQILAMMILFPLLRKFINSMKIFYVSFTMSFVGYIILLAISFSGTSNINLLLIPAFLIMSAIGMLNVIVTIFLANTVDYGELKNGTRDESVIFSMQTFVVKLASGISAFIASVVLSVFSIGSEEAALITDRFSRMGLRLSVTILPMVVLIVAVVVFKRKYILTDKKLAEINSQLK